MKKILSSLLNKRLIFQKLLQVENDEWVDYLNVYGHVKSIYNQRYGYSEIFYAMQLLPRNYFKVIVRYNNLINYDFRIIYGDKILNIKRIINHNEENNYLIIIAEEQEI